MSLITNFLNKFILPLITLVPLALLVVFDLFDSSFKDLFDVKMSEDVSIDNVTYISTSKDMKFHIEAESLKIFNKNEFKFEGINAKLPQDEQSEIKIKAEFADYNATSQVIKLYNNVIINYDEKTLTSNLIFYHAKDHTIFAPNDFSLQSSNLHMKGKDLTLDLKNKKLILKNQSTILRD